MPIFVIVAILFVGYIVFQSMNNQSSQPSKAPVKKVEEDDNVDDGVYPYIKKQYLLTIAEKKFYEALKQALANTDYYICPMVRVADVIQVQKGVDKWKSHFNKIAMKHIDFLLCEKRSMIPLVAIELDDKSHNQANRVNRDIFLEKALMNASLPLARFQVKSEYDVDEIRKEIQKVAR